MDLKIKDVADLLNVSETTIRRWLVDRKIPAYRLNHQYRFSRQEIENWVLDNKLQDQQQRMDLNDTSDQKKSPSSRGSKQFSLFRAIHKGDVLENISGENKETVIRTAVKSIATTLNLDAEGLTSLLLERESLQPTSLNNGIGIPHTRDFLLSGYQDVVFIAYPEKPIEYGALDGKPVQTLFFLFASNDKMHLHLLAKIAHLCSSELFQQFIEKHPEKNTLLNFIKEWESLLS